MKREVKPYYVKGYRRLRPSEFLRKGDQYWHDGEWHNTRDDGQKVCDLLVYRRATCEAGK